MYIFLELFMLRDLIQSKENSVFLDIGANIGHHSLFMSKFARQVLAFEPYELVRNQLELKIKTNQIENIQVHPVGLGLAEEELDFYAPKGVNTGTGSFVAAHYIQNNILFGKLRIVNADANISEQNLEKIDIIKMDVEGIEKNVLLGLKATFEKFRPILFMEFSADTQQTFTNESELLSLLPTGYRVKNVFVDKPYAYFFDQAKHHFVDFEFNESGGNIIFFPKEK
jgi:FkbM family methyltransferase